ncbi:predicted protein [Nematostella vectensis]|uniref:Mediator of RNA polymerase II transcription subunit 29 n=1 Tax=Nematostella vectensis TaxID=45351 RepID=A7SW44_NEMVE|nr:mediator of RNA polymerase II transcription subunit 29 [Nematostella vectensis]EDO32077.1 predicted protein [Nematostella vectensis]|eukprot:XP_001624177.1 predicted protein [Nematostella vectensis]
MAASGGGGTSSQPMESEQITRLKGLLLQYIRPNILSLLNQSDLALQQNVYSDTGVPGKSADNPNKEPTTENPHRLEKTMEDVLNSCDLMEDLLQTMKETEIQTLCSAKYSPRPVTHNKGDTSQETQSYPEYLESISQQIKSRMELQELLSDFVRSKLT